MNVEAHRHFACFGGTVTVHVRGTSGAGGERAAALAEAKLLDAHQRLSRFIPASELMLLNRDRREAVPASPLLRALACAVVSAGTHSGGLVDATLLDRIERAGYRQSLGHTSPGPIAGMLADQAPRRAARPHPSGRWRLVGVDDDAGTVIRPPGVEIDSGGIAKGLLADLLAAELAGQRAYAIDCCGDIRIGGAARAVRIGDPFGGEPIHELRVSDGAVATSGIGRRRWTGPGGRPAHHLLDPSTGEPAFTGLVQATAFAPTALLAETYAKSALLAGPERAHDWLPEGGVLVDEEGSVELVAAPDPRRRAAAA